MRLPTLAAQPKSKVDQLSTLLSLARRGFNIIGPSAPFGMDPDLSSSLSSSSSLPPALPVADDSSPTQPNHPSHHGGLTGISVLLVVLACTIVLLLCIVLIRLDRILKRRLASSSSKLQKEQDLEAQHASQSDRQLQRPYQQPDSFHGFQSFKPRMSSSTTCSSLSFCRSASRTMMESVGTTEQKIPSSWVYDQPAQSSLCEIASPIFPIRKKRWSPTSLPIRAGGDYEEHEHEPVPVSSVYNTYNPFSQKSFNQEYDSQTLATIGDNDELSVNREKGDLYYYHHQEHVEIESPRSRPVLQRNTVISHHHIYHHDMENEKRLLGEELRQARTSLSGETVHDYPQQQVPEDVSSTLHSFDPGAASCLFQQEPHRPTLPVTTFSPPSPILNNSNKINQTETEHPPTDVDSIPRLYVIPQQPSSYSLPCSVSITDALPQPKDKRTMSQSSCQKLKVPPINPSDQHENLFVITPPDQDTIPYDDLGHEFRNALVLDLGNGTALRMSPSPMVEKSNPFGIVDRTWS